MMVRKIASSLILGTACLCLIACDGGDDGGGGGGTPRPTNTPGGQATNTPGGQATPTPVGPLTGDAAVQAFASSILSSLGDLADLTGAGGGGGGSQIPSVPVPCPDGGTIAIACTATAGGSQSTYTFEDCRTVVEEAELDSFVDGSITLETTAACFTPPPTSGTMTVGIDAAVDFTIGEQVLAGTFDLTEAITQATDGTRTLEVNGTGDVDCVGAFEIETTEALVLPPDADCLTAGEVLVDIGGTDSIIGATEGGGLDLDYDADGTADDTVNSCDDSELATCG